ncbi:hypothetical protein GCWU000324_01262 [Kingella oralis ATCC 51147]|uniref:Uncharacterized protein n=1 Tax=Kingella oralis ATCC 51147 TaxID=629741 RepID=C4GGJ4_9NEIS|nr:hypothetical protein GCWU000324_01262 [Kingella oralis ATCC 51147]
MTVSGCLCRLQNRQPMARRRLADILETSHTLFNQPFGGEPPLHF